jgi:hypothetical protein
VSCEPSQITPDNEGIETVIELGMLYVAAVSQITPDNEGIETAR